MTDQQETTTTGGAAEAALNLAGRALPAGAGVDWWTKGWPLFTRQVGMWIAVSIGLFVILIVASFIPVLGQLAIFLFGPVIAGGLMVAAREVERGGELSFGQVFSCFSTHLGPLVMVGVLYLVGMIVVVGVVMLVGGASIGAMMMGASGGADPTAMRAAGGTGVLLVFLIALALILPLYMAVWFAPALVALNNVGAVDAMKASFFGCLKNIVPFLIYGIIGTLLGIVAAIPLGLGWLVLGPVLIGSVYVGYRDVFLGG